MTNVCPLNVCHVTEVISCARSGSLDPLLQQTKIIYMPYFVHGSAPQAVWQNVLSLTAEL